MCSGVMTVVDTELDVSDSEPVLSDDGTFDLPVPSTEEAPSRSVNPILRDRRVRNVPIVPCCECDVFLVWAIDTVHGDFGSC